MKNNAIEVIAPIDKIQLKRLLSGEMALNEYKVIEKSISERIYYFLETACQKVNAELDWYDYDNGDSASETDGYFDHERYSRTIKIEGGFHPNKNAGKDVCLIEGYFSSGLPIEVLFCDVEEKINKDLKELHEVLKQEEEELEEQARQEEQAKKDFLLMIEQIKGKLTPEEMVYVKFVQPSQSKKRK